MRFLGGLLALAIAVFVVVNVSNKPAYYVCSGTMTPSGQAGRPVQRVGLEIEMVPMLNRLLFRPKSMGLLILEQIAVLDIGDDSGTTLSIVNIDGTYRGEFDRISRHLDVFTGYPNGDTEYNLSCVETKLGSV